MMLRVSLRKLAAVMGCPFLLTNGFDCDDKPLGGVAGDDRAGQGAGDGARVAIDGGATGDGAARAGDGRGVQCEERVVDDAGLIFHGAS